MDKIDMGLFAGTFFVLGLIVSGIAFYQAPVVEEPNEFYKEFEEQQLLLAECYKEFSEQELLLTETFNALDQNGQLDNFGQYLLGEEILISNYIHCLNEGEDVSG